MPTENSVRQWNRIVVHQTPICYNNRDKEKSLKLGTVTSWTIWIPIRMERRKRHMKDDVREVLKLLKITLLCLLITLAIALLK